MTSLRFFLVSQLQQLVVSGELPCSREEAVTLAGIQLHVDEAWPDGDDEHLSNEQDGGGGGDARENDQLLMSIRSDWRQSERRRREIYTLNRCVTSIRSGSRQNERRRREIYTLNRCVTSMRRR